MMMGSPLAMKQTPSVSPDDVARGYRLDCEFTNAAYSYAMPTNGVRYERWWKRGAYEDVFRLDLCGTSFPLADELLTSFWVYSWGMAGAHLGNASNRLVAIGTPMSAVPGLSQFWSAALPDGARRLTWQDFALNRDTNNLVSAQLELFPNGDFIARSNEVMRVYRRVNPDDWDDDGDPNETDADPYVAGEPTFGPEQQLPEGANSNAYCWVDLVVSGATSLVTFSGEGASNLSDPSFIALPGETNRVMLLIGKEYRVSSRMPICCVGRSDYAIEVSQDSATSLAIVWPVTIEPVAMRSGASFSMSVVPDFLGGGFTWTNCCCSISSSGNSFTYSCDENCHCSGCAALGCYTYEGFMLPASGGSCGCSETEVLDPDSTNEPPASASVTVSFSQNALFYEEAYTNEPGVVIGRRVSTNATLTCSVSGGQYGGVFSLSRQGFGMLTFVVGDTLPDGTVEIAAGETRSWTAEYSPHSHSTSENDISAAVTFSEYMTGETHSSTAQLTIVKLTLQPQVTREGYENRHLVGVRECINCYADPHVGQWGETGGGEYRSDRGYTGFYKCPLTADGSVLYYTVGGSRYDFDLVVVEPSGIVARLPVARDFGIATNHAGGVGMNLEVFVQPETVSFSGIAMEEIPSTTGIHEGYFTNTYFESEWYHTEARGAGKWKNIWPDNLWDTDHAWFAAELPRELPNGEMIFDLSYGTWTNGTIVWNITWGWNEMNTPKGEPPVKSITTPYNQTFTFTEDGLLMVSKFQHSVSRGTNGVMRLNGNIVQGVIVTQEELNAVFENN